MTSPAIDCKGCGVKMTDHEAGTDDMGKPLCPHCGSDLMTRHTFRRVVPGTMSMNTKIGFGMYENWTIGQVWQTFPGHIRRAVENNWGQDAIIFMREHLEKTPDAIEAARPPEPEKTTETFEEMLCDLKGMTDEQ